MRAQKVGVYPGSFNPLTVAHVEVARVARASHDLQRIVLMVSEVALDKAAPPGPTVDERMNDLQALIAPLPWLDAEITQLQLIADIASGYDVVIMGADKWHQIHDQRYYTSVEHRDEALARLPQPAVAPREGFEVPAQLVLDIDEAFWPVSSTLARTTHHHYRA